jgi:predicted alpha/beta-fold hydrolase
MQFTKQSLVDYQITENGNHLAWIQKTSDGYKMVIKAVMEGFEDTVYWFSSLKSAKDFAKENKELF